jgi:hypothetical protein
VQAARKPNFVLDDHSSRPWLTPWLKQPTRRFRLMACAMHDALHLVAPGRYALSPKRSRQSLPIWSCSVWGLPCGSTYAGPGGLLPHRFTLTADRVHGPVARANNLRRFIFCCTGRPAGLNQPSRTLSGTLPCGVRTFLPPSTASRERQRSSGRLHSLSV